MTKLIADIGGTNARFAMVSNDNIISNIQVLACADYPTLSDAVQTYLSDQKIKPVTGAFAVATPLDGSDQVTMMNHVWSFSIQETKEKAGLEHLVILNDFTALALSVPRLSQSDYKKISDHGTPVPFMPIGIIGPGTGLGVSAIVFDQSGKAVPVTTEGGHVTMPATTQREFDIFAALTKAKYHHISAERVVSGKGIVNLYNGIHLVDNISPENLSPADITQRGLNQSCSRCTEAIELFCHFLGIVAGNLALSYGANGGIYIAGGIVPQLGDFFLNSRFRESFEAKGRYKDYLSRIPTYLITHPFPGLEGLKYL